MDKCWKNQPKIHDDACSEEVSSIEWEFIDMNEQEEDVISRMHRLVGGKWALIAGRVPGRKPEEIERYWLMKNNNSSKTKRIGQKRKELS